MAIRKFSKQRESIRANLKQRSDHPTAEMIYSDIRIQYPNISLGTVYRNLTVLAEEGEIRKISLTGGAEHFDGDVSPHHHVVCRSCGRIFDLQMDTPAVLYEEAASRFTGMIESCHIGFYGVCEACGAC